MKKTLTEGNDSQDANEEKDEVQDTNAIESPITDTLAGQAIDNGKVVGFKSEYLDSLDPSSYEDTCQGLDVDDAERYKLMDNYFALSVPL